MDIDSRSLRLLDPSDGSLLNSQAIHSIRVWGVGRDNGRWVILGDSAGGVGVMTELLPLCLGILLGVWE